MYNAILKIITARRPPSMPNYLDSIQLSQNEFKLKWGLPAGEANAQQNTIVILQFQDDETGDWQNVQGPFQGTSHRHRGN